MTMKLPPFQRLVDAHWRDVARLAHALSGPAEGDDVAQQAWARALSAYPGLTSATNLRSWLMTITVNCARDAQRSRARSPVPVPDLRDLQGEARAADPVPLGPGDTAEPLWTAVRALPERQRIAVALRYVADLDHAQIAAALGTTPAASRRLTSDALAVLRDLLGAVGVGPGQDQAVAVPGVAR
jgi:RNA polymerase sigma factor (sigma-70 family)